MPGAVPTATKTEPVATLSVIPALVDDTADSVTRAAVAGVPPSVSFARTLASAVLPGSVDALSFTASMTYGDRTVTVTVASSQFEAAAISQIRYTSVWIPTAVPAATSTAPVAGSSATPSEVDDCCVSVTCAGVAGMPPSRSLARTFATAVPPAVVTVALSSTASIT